MKPTFIVSALLAPEDEPPDAEAHPARLTVIMTAPNTDKNFLDHFFIICILLSFLKTTKKAICHKRLRRYPICTLQLHYKKIIFPVNRIKFAATRKKIR